MHQIPKSLDGWTYDIISKLIENKVVENELFDFKANLPDVNTLTEICCSFANSKGGFIVFGVIETNSSFNIEGIENDRERAHKFGQKVRSEPHIRFEAPKVIDIPGSNKVLTIFYIPRGSTLHVPLDEKRRIFWKRTNKGKEYMTLTEIRDIFQRDLKKERDDLMQLVNQIHMGEHKRRLNKKKYYVVRISSYFGRVRTQYMEYVNAIENYLTDNNEPNWQMVNRKAVSFKGYIDEFTGEAVEDIKPIQDILESTRLADKFAMMINLYDQQLKSYVVEDVRCHDSKDLIRYNTEMESLMNELNQLIEDLNVEISDTK